MGQGSVTPNEFEKILHFVGIRNILSPDEWLFRLKHDKLKGSDICITFDDGLKCQYDVILPILERYNLKAFWFICSTVCEGGMAKVEIYNYFGMRYFKSVNDFYECFFSKCEKNILDKLEGCRFKEYLSRKLLSFPFYSNIDLKFRFLRDEILHKEEFEYIMQKIMEEKGVDMVGISKDLWLSNAELKGLSEKGHCMGLHSYDHPFQLSSLSYENQLEQYSKNYMHIKKLCSKEVISMSHPLNSYNKNTLKILKKLGILCGFRSNMSASNGGRINPTSLEIAREDPQAAIFQRGRKGRENRFIMEKINYETMV